MAVAVAVTAVAVVCNKMLILYIKNQNKREVSSSKSKHSLVPRINCGQYNVAQGRKWHKILSYLEERSSDSPGLWNSLNYAFVIINKILVWILQFSWEIRIPTTKVAHSSNCQAVGGPEGLCNGIDSIICNYKSIFFSYHLKEVNLHGFSIILNKYLIFFE